MPDEYLLKICIIGVPDKLKMTMVRTYVGGRFLTDILPTLGVDIITKQIQVNSNNIKLILVVTAGGQFYRQNLPSYYRGASAAIIVFDKEDRDTFIAVKKCYKEFVKELNRVKKPRSQVPIALVGFITKKVYIPTFLKIQKDGSLHPTKEELYEEITADEGQSLAEELNLLYYETRPRDKKTTKQIFHDLTLKILGYMS